MGGDSFVLISIFFGGKAFQRLNFCGERLLRVVRSHFSVILIVNNFTLTIIVYFTVKNEAHVCWVDRHARLHDRKRSK